MNYKDFTTREDRLKIPKMSKSDMTWFEAIYGFVLFAGVFLLLVAWGILVWK